MNIQWISELGVYVELVVNTCVIFLFNLIPTSFDSSFVYYVSESLRAHGIKFKFDQWHDVVQNIHGNQSCAEMFLLYIFLVSLWLWFLDDMN